MSERATFTTLVHGESKVGKSWYGAGGPAPRLILDSEGRGKYTPSKFPKVYWDPRKGPPPRADGTWDTCIAPVADFDLMALAYKWLRQGDHDFVTVDIDSLMEVQKRCMDAEVGTNQMMIQDWGTVLRKLEALVRSYRDLTLVSNNTVSVVVFIVGTTNVDGVQRPLLQGALRNTVPYYVDCTGYIFKQPVTSPDGQTTYTRSMLVDAQPGFVAGDGTGKLQGPVIQNPKLSEIYDMLSQVNEEVS